VLSDMKEQRFGVEIELTFITRYEAINIIAAHFNTTTSYVGSVYNAYSCTDMFGRTWKVVRDASIRCQKRQGGAVVAASDEYSVELVTPPLQYNDIETLQEIIRKLRNAGAEVNNSCGVHVHIDACWQTAQSLKNIINIMISKQDLIFKSLEVKGRRESYCKKLEDDLALCLKTIKNKELTIRRIEDIWYSGYENDSRQHHYNSSRYHCVNLHSTFTRGTVEFRMFPATLHAGKIKTYIQFCQAICFQALRQQRTSSKKTESTNEKYTFRTWLIRLGLNGEEYKTARYHLLKNLSGNIAWRNK
jgi:hypothetical protein